jgi:hypothetical protein
VGAISVARVGHIAAQTTGVRLLIAEPLEAPTEIGPPLEARRVATVHRRATAPAVAIVTRVPTGERDLPPPRVARRVATVRPVATAIAAVAAPRVGVRATVEGTRAIARSGRHGVNATVATRAPNRLAWTSPMFPRT